MFNNGKSAKNGQNHAQVALNMISEGTRIKGTLETQDDTRIAGILDGDLTVKGKLNLSKSARIKGNIHAKEADVAGKVDGEVVVEEKLTLRSTAMVTGDIKTKVLLVEEGAHFDGTCSMESSASASISAPKKRSGILNLSGAKS